MAADFSNSGWTEPATAPQLQTALSVSDYVPSDAIPKAIEKYRIGVSTAADDLVASLRAESATRSPKVEALRGGIQAKLGGDQDVSPELATEAEGYRTRLSTLEQQATDLAALDQEINDDLNALDILIDKAAASWADLRKARQITCATVNKSMQSFFVRLTPQNLTEDIDRLLDELKTGTRLHESSMQEIRDALDRQYFVRAAIEYLQFPAQGAEQDELDGVTANMRRIAQESVDRTKSTESQRSQSFNQVTESTFSEHRRVKTLCHLTTLRRVSRRSRLRNSHSPRRSYRRSRTNQRTLCQRPPSSKTWYPPYGNNARLGSSSLLVTTPMSWSQVMWKG